MNVKDKKKIQKKPKTSPSARCLGPIADLEKHLPVDWWRSLFNSIYLKTDADVIENDKATINEIDLFLKIARLEPSDNILDLCCGQGRHSLELADRGFQFLSGIDRSRFLVRLARNRAQKSGYHIKFSEGDARRIRLPDQSFDCVMIMGNSFGYFEKAKDDLKVLREANRILHDGGILYLDIMDGAWMKDNFEKRSWEWIDEELMVCRERNLSTESTRLISREVVIHAEKGVIADQFYAERLYTFEELSEQLSEAGFESIQRHENTKAISTREQDLGMMANRIVITAKAPQKIKPKAIKVTGKITCTVLMGDPHLPDKVKRDGKFNNEDFNTINKLKEALGTLENFRFTYFDDHKSFIRKFTTTPPNFVFNLCDEGWKNEPFMELHPPALMEMLGIPYTGAGPECLSICYNKALVRAIAHEMEIMVPDEIWIDPTNHSAALPSIFPALMKPAFGDSSIGITQDSVVQTAEELVNCYDRLKQLLPDTPILIQEFLGGREFSVCIIGNGDNIEILPILEVDYSELPSDLPKILGYESKWYPESPYWNSIKYFQADLDEFTARTMIDSSINLFHRLKCRDYARFDFRMDMKGRPKLLEINPNPGWCWDGKMALMAKFNNISYIQVLEKVLMAALDRYPNHRSWIE